jgi:hypothetical protein
MARGWAYLDAPCPIICPKSYSSTILRVASADVTLTILEGFNVLLKLSGFGIFLNLKPPPTVGDL